MRRRILPTTAVLAALLALGGSAALAAGHTRSRCGRGYVLRRGYLPHKRHKRISVCVKRTKPRIVTIRVPVTTTVTVPAPTPPSVRAVISLSHTQDPSNPLKVTWTYSASNPDGPLPASTLRLVVDGQGTVSGNSGGCSVNVDGTTPGASCTLTLPQAGDYSVTVNYDGGINSSASVSPTVYTETDHVQ